jgi:large subunit ribosomal protein L19
MHEKLIAFNLKQRQARTLPDLRSGDVVKIYRKIREGSKERVQVFQGTIIAIRGGQSASPTITVRKVAFGVGVELVMPLLSPQIEKIEFVKRSRVRRAKLYFVREKSVKVLSRKLRETDVKDLALPEPVETLAVEPETITPEKKVETPPASKQNEQAAEKPQAPKAE